MTTLSTSNRLPTTVPAGAHWAAYGAATWALGFVAVNRYLQIVGIDDTQIQQNWAAFTAVNLGVVGFKAFGAAVALATVQRWGRVVPAWLVSTCAWGAAGALLLYAATGLAFTAARGALLDWSLAGGTFVVPNLAYLGFFALPGVLFAVAARHHQRRTDRHLAGVGRRRAARRAARAGRRHPRVHPGLLTMESGGLATCRASSGGPSTR